MPDETLGRIADNADQLDLSAVEASTFARLVATASATQLEGALADPRSRALLLDEIFRRMQSHVRSDRVKRMNAVVRWRLTGGTGEGGYDRYECVLADGACVVTKERSPRPRVTITLAPTDFVRIITRQATPAVLYVTGKLQVKGDLGFAAGLIGYFDLPKT